jgi:hypothetical protein
VKLAQRVSLHARGQGLAYCIHRSVKPIHQWEHAEICVVIGSGRAPNLDTSYNAFTILDTVVRVIPGRAVLRRFESVNPCFAGGNRTFGDTTNTVMLVRLELSKTVPVDTGAVGCE